MTTLLRGSGRPPPQLQHLDNNVDLAAGIVDGGHRLPELPGHRLLHGLTISNLALSVYSKILRFAAPYIFVLNHIRLFYRKFRGKIRFKVAADRSVLKY